MPDRKVSLNRSRLRIEELDKKYLCKYRYDGEWLRAYGHDIQTALDYIKMDLWEQKFENNDYNERNELWRYE